MSRRARVRAPAKVNLVLRVLGRRADGYHEIDTLFQAIDLCDEVEVELAGRGLAVEVEGLDVGPEEENLAYRAAARFLEEVGRDAGVRIRLGKRIPMGAGLGGGSSNAAAVLRCLDLLLGGIEPARLAAIGAELGSDVPFFLGESALALGRGRGERLEALPALPEADLALVSPPVHVSTGAAYAALSEVRGGLAPLTASGDTVRPGRWEDLASVAHNDFQAVIAAAHPEVRRALHALRGAGASVTLMSGSGSTCFGLFADRRTAGRAAEDLSVQLGWTCRAVRTLDALPEPSRSS